MVFTRAEAQAALTHVIDNVMDLQGNSALRRALLRDGFQDIRDVIGMTHAEIDALKVPGEGEGDAQTPPTDLSTFIKARLRILKSYVLYRQNIGDPIGTDWTSLTMEQFDEYRTGRDYLSSLEPNQVGRPVVSNQVNASAAGNIPRRDPLADFKKGVKRDTSLFAVYKDEKQWDTWQRSTVALARAQDVADVLDDAYVPDGEDATALFNEKQKFMYAVFERTLQTDQGKAFVRAHEHDFNAQVVYRKLKEYSIKSTKASLDSSKTLAYITTARIGDGTWKGTAHSFILHWQDQVRLYEKLVSDADRLPENVKRSMLENAVRPIDMLQAVKNQADQMKTQSGKDLTYEEYCRLLLSAASTYDASFKPRNRSMNRQAVYNHEMMLNDNDNDIYLPNDDHDDVYDIDIGIDTIQANVNSQMKPLTRIPFGAWKQMSAEAQKIWDTIPDRDKSFILTAHKQSLSTKSNKESRNAMTPRSAFVHEMDDDQDALMVVEQVGDDSSFVNGDTNDDTNGNVLANATKQKPVKKKTSIVPPSDIRRILSTSSKASSSSTANDTKEVTINGKLYRQVNVAMSYHISATSRSNVVASLVDRGANGGIAGDDVRVIYRTERSVDIQGIDNHQLTNVPIVTAGGVVNSQYGPVIAILNQYAYVGRGRSIHSSAQLEWYKNDVNDRSIKVEGGLQRMLTLDGYVHPINIVNGLPYITMRPYTDDEWDSLPHVIWTSDNDWDPCVLDHTVDLNEHWYDACTDQFLIDQRFDEEGNYRHRFTVQESVMQFQDVDNIVDDIVDNIVYYNVQSHDVSPTALHSPTPSPRMLLPKSKDYDSLQPFFGWLPTNVIKKTFEVTTQFARMPMSTILKKRYKSPNPALNVHRRNEAIATDTVYSDTPAIGGGETCAQVFVGTTSLVTDVEGMKTEKQFVNTLEDNIRRRGAPTKLISDRAQVEISNKVKDILRTYCISDWQSEPHQQHQNPCERRYQTMKSMANTILDRTGSPAFLWLQCLMYVCFILNNTSSDALNGAVPLQVLTGSTNDISPLLFFQWYEPVYYKVDDSDFPSSSREQRGRWIGVAEHVGHAMTFKILTDDTQKIIYRSNIRSARDPKSSNLRQDPLNDSVPIIKSRHDSAPSLDHGEPVGSIPIVDINDLIGRTFLMPPEEDGQRFRARIVRAIDDHESDLAKDPKRIQFLCSLKDDQVEEIISYNDLLQYLDSNDDDIVWKFRRITGHQGPLTQKDKDWKGSQFNVMVEWENGETTSEPLAILAADDPVTCAIYARDNNLLDTDGWKRFKRIARRQKTFDRLVNQAKRHSYNTAPRFKYGFEIPRNYEHAKELDKRNGNTRWMDCTMLELSQLDEYGVFEDHGYKGTPPPGYKKIRTHLIYDVKHDGRHKARMVADGHLTDVPLDSVYSGVVSLRGLRTLVFIAELNGLDTWATDIGNAYLEAKTKECIYIVAGPEFSELEGHTLVIVKALYGLRTSGLRWHERFADCLRDMGFFPSKAESDIWMRERNNLYEYIGVYVDDLAIVAKSPEEIIDILSNKYGFKLKGTGPISYHLGMEFFRDSTGVLCISAKKYVEKMISSYQQFFGSKPIQKYSSPLEKGDHPELDTSELLDNVETQRYQSLVGAMQWAVSIGRIDITTAVMTLSGFRTMPRHGHMDRVKRVYGYLAKMKDAVIRIRTDEPDLSALPIQEFDWEKSVYGNISEIVPTDAPKALGKYVVLIHYFDANLYHDMATGRSVTGILHLFNKTPIDWYSKKQATVETATYGSEFIAARTCVDQIIDLRTYLRYLGVPIRDQSYVFGDNRSVVDSSTVPHAKLHKRHNALSFHRVREAVASKLIRMYYVAGEYNPADILSKHWGYQQIWCLLQPLLFYQGDTINLIDDDD